MSKQIEWEIDACVKLLVKGTLAVRIFNSNKLITDKLWTVALFLDSLCKDSILYCHCDTFAEAREVANDLINCVRDHGWEEEK